MNLYRDRAPRAAIMALIASAAMLYLAPALADSNDTAAGTVRAGDDFWRFANGDWERGARIPDGHVTWGVRQQLRAANSQKMATLYEAAAAGMAGDSNAKKAGDYYMAQLDLAGIEAKGSAPIQPMLARIAALENKTALASYLGATVRIDADPVNFGFYDSQYLFGLWIAPGLHDTRHYVPYLLQGGLVLPSPDAYLSQDAESQALRAEYRQYIIAMLEQVGIGDAPHRADGIIALESRIAKVHAAPPDSADLAKAGSIWRRAEFAAKAPGLDWNAWFKAAGLSSQQSFDVWQPGAIQGIAALVASAPMAAWRDYLVFHAITEHARFLPKAFADRYFAFFDPLFLGPSQHLPRWEHVLNQTNTDMPDAGQLFADHYLSPPARAKAGEMVANIVTAFGRRLERLEWMTPASKQEALAKLKNLHIGIGSPDRWQDIGQLEIRPGDALGNMERVQAFNYRHEIAKLGLTVDRTEWIRGAELFGINSMPLQNALTIPVTELQSPFFDPDGPDAENYAALGARIGYFLAQVFDIQGCRFDAQGRVRNWCNKTDLANFQRAAAPLVAQYGEYHPFPDLAIDGNNTLNSNIADLAGLSAAYDAFHLSRSTAVSKEEERRFFIAYAESLRQTSTEPALRGQIAHGKQAPASYRAAIVRNMDAWYSAFDVTPDQTQYLAPEARIRIW